MKLIQGVILTAVLLFSSVLQSLALPGVHLSIQNSTDVVLRWPSSPGQTFIIGYRATLDASTPWTFLETAYNAASSGTETTYVHPGVVAGGAGGGGAALSQASGESTAWSTMTEEERTARRAEISKWAQQMAEELMAMLKAAIEQAQANRERWAKEGKPTTQSSASTAESTAAAPPLGSMGFYFVSEYSEDMDGDLLPNGFELSFNSNPLNHDSDDDTINDAEEDFDGDGLNNFDEYVWGTLPSEPDNDYPLPPPAFGSAYSGEMNLSYTPQAGFDEVSEGPYLSADDFTAGGLVLTTTPGNLRARWHTIYLGPAGTSQPSGAPNANDPNDPFNYVPTEEERALIKAANGDTDISAGKIGQISQEVYDQMPEHLLEHLAEKAAHGLKRTEKILQEIESGQRQATEGFRRALVANMITQRLRLNAAVSSLVRRFGRAVARYLPFLGGIFIIATAAQVAEDFQAAFQDYEADIRNGDDTTGSAAILAGNCNNLAPGSGNIVLNYLLR